MAWNGSGGASDVSAQRRGSAEGRSNSTSHQAPSTRHQARRFTPHLALAVVVIGGGLVWWFVAGRQDSVSEAPIVSHAAPIKRYATTAKRQTLPVPGVDASEPKVVVQNARPTKVGEVVNGYVLLPSGRLHRRVGVITNSAASRPQAAYRIFNNDTDNEIACYLSIKPGEGPFGPRRYTGRFKEKFLESLKTPIEIMDDDTPEQAQLKRDVLAARVELKEALDRGEDIERIMLDTREELQDLTHYRAEVQSLFNETRLNACETEQDVEDLFDACNKLLEDKGIAPIKFGPITRRRILSERQK